jgi:hypothetical protein
MDILAKKGDKENERGGKKLFTCCCKFDGI